MTRTRLIIPCYNEEQSIPALLSRIKNLNQDNLASTVIDDGSTDSTRELVKVSKQVNLISLPFNLGVGAAVQTGLKYSFLQKDDFAIKLDGDGQHPPENIEKILLPLMAGDCDIVIGSRFLEKNPQGFQSTFMRRLGISFLQKLCYFLTKTQISDPTSGFRAYNKRAIEFMAEHYPSFDYPEPEEIILAIKNGLRVKEVQVQMEPRKFGESSISSVYSVYYMIKVSLAMLFIYLRQPEKEKRTKDVG